MPDALRAPKMNLRRTQKSGKTSVFVSCLFVRFFNAKVIEFDRDFGPKKGSGLMFAVGATHKGDMEFIR